MKLKLSRTDYNLLMQIVGIGCGYALKWDDPGSVGMSTKGLNLMSRINDAVVKGDCRGGKGKAVARAFTVAPVLEAKPEAWVEARAYDSKAHRVKPNGKAEGKADGLLPK